MELLLPIAEQLDRAAVELQLDHPIHNRLALILIDNAVELMVRRSLWVHVGKGGDFAGITAKHRKLSRSQSFPDRLSILVFVGELSQQEKDFVVAVHQHRNAVYHEGLHRDDFHRQMAMHYYEFACSYIARFSMGFYSWSSAFQFTDIGKRYYEQSKDGDETMSQIDRAKLATILLDQLPPAPSKSLQDALADDLERERSGVTRGVRFMIENVHPRKTVHYILEKAQVDYARDKALEKEGLEQTIYGTDRRIEAIKFLKSKKDKFAPRYRAVPHGSWSQSIGRVRSSADPQIAMIRFQRLRRTMAFLCDAIDYAVAVLEGELDRK